MSYLTILILCVVFVTFSATIFLAGRYVRCPSNKVLCVYGLVSGGRSVRCFHGGSKFVWPLIQEARFLDLTPMPLNIPLRGALSQQNIRVNAPSVFTIAINPEPDTMNNAAVRLLDLSNQQIESMATEIILGQLRLTIASLTIEQINSDREKFLEAIRSNVDPELRKIGLSLINVNITDITDESGYIDSIGKKAASTAINQAKVDVAEQEKRGDIGKAEAEFERRVKVATLNASAVEGENNAQAQIAKYGADLAEQQAEAKRRSQMADQQANTEIQKIRAVAEAARLEAEEIVPKQIERRKVEIDADAVAEREKREASGESNAILALRSAEAEGIQKVLAAKAEGYRGLVQACMGDPRAAATMLLVEKMDELVKVQVEAIKNIKIDKITVWDGANGGADGKGTSTANFLSGMIKTLPPIHDVAQMAGVDLPSFLGEVRAPETLKNGPTKS